MACCSASPPLTTCMQHGFCSCSLPPPHANYLFRSQGIPTLKEIGSSPSNGPSAFGTPQPEGCSWIRTKAPVHPWACHGSKVGNALGLELLHTAGSEMVHARVDRMPEAARRSPCGDAPRAAIGFAQSRQPRHRQSGAAPAHSSAVSGRCFFSFKACFCNRVKARSPRARTAYGTVHAARLGG